MSRADYQSLVQSHYKEEARSHGLGLTSTMADVVTRQKEIDAIVALAMPGEQCLEVGCGNGAASIEIAKAVRLTMTCIDFSPDLLALAQQQPIKDVKGSILFQQHDVLALDTQPLYDFIFTQRCIINILDWSDQREALRRMASALRPGGRLALIEAFTDGLRELNQTRKEIGLPEVPPAYHNLHLDKGAVIEHLAGYGLEFQTENNFLSSYYFGTRVIYPALAQSGKVEPIYNSAFAKFFEALPAIGNYAHIKLLTFQKR